MDEVKLIMTFENSSGDKTMINISGVRPDITKTEVDALGNFLVDKTIFSYKNSSLTKYTGAQVQTIHTEIL